MRIATWNCRLADPHEAARHVGADLVALQETRPSSWPVLAIGTPKKSLALIAEPPGALVPGPERACSARFVLPAVWQRGSGPHFRILAIWTHSPTGGGGLYPALVREILATWQDWICESPTLLLGDLNLSPSVRQRPQDHLAALRAIETLGLVSAYHAFTGEPYGAESQPTYSHGRGRTFTLDYVFVPAAWRERIRSVAVGCDGGSDHRPVIVDLDL